LSPSASPWFIHAFDLSEGVTPERFIALRGLAADFYCGLFHSAAAAEVLATESHADSSAEWSLLLLAPDDGEQIDLLALDQGQASFLSRLDAAVATTEKRPYCETTQTYLPFASGWQLYLGYELAAEVEPVLHQALAEYAQGIAAQARRVRGALLFNHASQQAWCCLEHAQAEQFERVCKDLQRLPATYDKVTLEAVLEDEADQFTGAVSKTLDYIRDGDVFQVNLSRAWQLATAEAVSSAAIYQQLIKKNPAPFSAWLSVHSAQGDGGFELISSSPERLVAIEPAEDGGSWVNTRPIAGTRPRISGDAKDQHYLNELKQSPKENAEHLMLIDLERNDLGRVCVPGSIEVNELMSIESFAHVHHIVSNVRGKKRADASVGEVIAAVFPGGTITGCPKVRCMQIIAELEQCARGAYTGAVGYLGLDGQLDLNIVIRSLVRSEQAPATLHLRAGAGIVADSNAQHELEETRAKANSVLRAFEVSAA
jgi:anthranilate synthase component 1